MHSPLHTPDMGKVRVGRSSLDSIERAIETRTLHPDDAQRWIRRMRAAFDEVLGPPPAAPPPRPGPFTVMRGGRP